MATKPTKTEKQYYDEAYAKNKGIVDQQYAERQKTTKDSINQYAGTVDNQVNTTAGEYQKQIDSAPGKYQSLYNENAIREIAARANLQEQMANAGIVDSGLNRTQMTSLANQKGNADAAVSQQKQDYINQLSDAILKVKAEGEANKAGYANQMNTADAQWYRDAILGAHTTAQDTAQKQVQADWDSYIAQVKAEQEAIEKQRDYELQMRKLGYVLGDDGKWDKDTSAATGDNLSLLKAINDQTNTNVKNGMKDDVAAAYARIAYEAGTASDYALVENDRIQSGAKAYSEGGSTGLAEYLNSLNMSDEEKKRYASEIKTAATVSPANSNYSEKKYIRVGKQTGYSGKINDNDQVAWVDETGNQHKMTIKQLYDELVKEGYSKSDAKEAVSKFNKYDETNGSTYQTLFKGDKND